MPLIWPSFPLLSLREAHTSYVPARPSSRNLDAHPPAAAAHALDLDFLDVRGGNRSTRGSAHKKEAAQEGATRAPLKKERDRGVISGGIEYIYMYMYMYMYMYVYIYTYTYIHTYMLCVCT